MFKPQIQRIEVVVTLAIFSIVMVYFTLSNITYVEKLGLKEKIKSTEIMEKALSTLKKEVKSRDDSPILKDIDPNLTGLIFIRPQSPMITYSGDLRSKQTVLKPNFGIIAVVLAFLPSIIWSIKFGPLFSRE